MIWTHHDRPTLDDVRTARRRIAATACRTALEESPSLGERVGAPVLLKLECWQPTRSFKVRGAANAVAGLEPARLARGLVTASAGNHGLAVALAARRAGVALTVYLPRAAPAVKRERIRAMGAAIRDEFDSYDDAERAAIADAAARDQEFVHAFSDPAVIAGQGTIGLELLEDAPQVCDVIVPVGGGGLISGIGLVLRTLAPAVRVIGVQSTQTRAMHAAFAAGHVVAVPVPPTLADGLAGCTDDATFQRARDVVDEIVLVEEDEIAAAIRALFTDDVVTAEGSGAVGVAALLARRITPRGPTAVIVTGGNVDPRTLCDVLGRGTRNTERPE
jgi:threonine dehydratase